MYQKWSGYEGDENDRKQLVQKSFNKILKINTRVLCVVGIL